MRRPYVCAGRTLLPLGGPFSIIRFYKFYIKGIIGQNTVNLHWLQAATILPHIIRNQVKELY